MGEGNSNAAAIAKMQAEWDSASAELRKPFTALLAQAKSQLSYAKEQQARWAKEMRALQAFKDDVSRPENNTYVSVSLLHQAYVSLQQMTEIEVAAYTHNVAIVSPGGGPAIAPQVPASSPLYLEHKRRMFLAMSRYFVRYNIQGIDTVLRATSKGRCITPVGEAQQAERDGATKALQAAAERSEVMAQFLDKLSDDLQAVRQINKRQMAAFDGWDRLDEAGRSALLAHGDWARLEDLIPLLQQLRERTATFPALQDLFVPWKQEKLPFAVTPPKEPAAAQVPKGPDKLDVGGSGKTATLRLP